MAAAFSATVFSRPIEGKGRVARLDQITRRFNELDLGQLSLRIESVQQAFLARRCSSRTPARAVRLAEAESLRASSYWYLPNSKSGFLVLASHLQGSQGTLSRQIVSLFSPDTLGLVAHPGSAATAGHPHQP